MRQTDGAQPRRQPEPRPRPASPDYSNRPRGISTSRGTVVSEMVNTNQRTPEQRPVASTTKRRTR